MCIEINVQKLNSKTTLGTETLSTQNQNIYRWFIFYEPLRPRLENDEAGAG